MRKQINDIRIGSRSKEKNILNLRRDDNKISLQKNLTKITDTKDINEFRKERLNSAISEVNFKELVSSDRRNFLKILVTSGGVLLAGSFLNKINKFKNISLINQPAKSFGSMVIPSVPQSVKDDGLDKDFESFFDNFRLVRNDKEYILYNKDGDNILTIDRDV